jgi:hypothetical protein
MRLLRQRSNACWSGQKSEDPIRIVIPSDEPERGISQKNNLPKPPVTPESFLSNKLHHLHHAVLSILKCCISGNARLNLAGSYSCRNVASNSHRLILLRKNIGGWGCTISTLTLTAAHMRFRGSQVIKSFATLTKSMVSSRGANAERSALDFYVAPGFSPASCFGFRCHLLHKT